MASQPYKKFKSIPLIILLVGVVVSFFLFEQLRESEREIVWQRLQTDADRHISDLEASLSRRIIQIRSVANLFSSTDFVTEREFSNFASQVYDGFGPDRRLSWLDITTYEELPQLTDMYKENASEGLRNFEVFDYGDNQKLPLASNHEQLIIWAYTMPKVPNENTVHGRNLTPKLPIFQSLSYTLENKKLFLSLFRPPIAPLTDPLILIVAPVLKSIGETETHLDGMIVSGNVIRNIFEESIAGTTDRYNYFMRDDAGTLYSFQNNALYEKGGGPVFSGQTSMQKQISVANRRFDIIVQVRQAAVETLSYTVYLLPLMTLILSVLVAYIAFIVVKQQRLLAIEVRHKTKELSEKVHEVQTINNSLNEAKIQAEAASVAKSNFLSTMSHELRTPLTSVLGFLDLLRDAKLSESEKKYIETARFSSVVLLDLINDILDFSKLDAGQMKPQNKAFNMTKLVEDVVASLKPQATNKSLSLSIKADREEPFLLNLDIKFLRQILLNIIGNAIKYTHQGSVTVSLSGDDEACYIDVVDTGVGIAEQDFEHLFTKFERLGDQNQPGTGLGLAIAQKLVHLMNGDIRVFSQLNKGSKFSIRLPFDNTLKEADIAQEVDVESKDDISKIQGMCVLIVDDNEINRMVLSATLKKWRVGYVECASGQEAVDFMRSEKSALIDIIFMDINMPKMSGIEAMQYIREANPKFKSLPIYAVTANSDKEDVETYIKSGFTGYVAKPLDMALLRSCLQIHAND